MDDQQSAINNPQFCRQMNANNSSTRNLPNEVLSFIFELVCAPIGTEDPPKDPRIALASVCSHWHDVVWNISQLWPTLSVTVRGHNLKKAASTLQMFADNHRAPEYARFNFALSGEDIEELWQPFEAFLSQETTPCIRRITLRYLTPACVAVVKLVNERCCDIERLYLSQDCSLSVSERTFEIPTCWSKLTTLQLKRIPLDTCFDLLFGCPRLIDLSCDELVEPTNKLTQPPSHQAQTVTFPHLESLSLNTRHKRYHRAWVDNLLQFYRFPALTWLHWLPGSCSHSPELFNHFLSALPQCFYTLKFTVPRPPVWLTLKDSTPRRCMETALLHVGNIKNLTLCSPCRSLLPWMMQKLEDSAFLPSLTSLQFSRTYCKFTEDPLFLYDFYQMFKGRKKTGVQSFELRMWGWGFEFVDWKDERAKVSRLMDDGSFEAEIFCDGEKAKI